MRNHDKNRKNERRDKHPTKWRQSISVIDFIARQIIWINNSLLSILIEQF